MYMLRIKGEDMEKDMEVDMEFLMEAFELGEAVEDAKSKEELLKIDSENQHNVDELVRRISVSFKYDDIATAKQNLVKLKYLVTVSEKVQERLRDGSWNGWMDSSINTKLSFIVIDRYSFI